MLVEISVWTGAKPVSDWCKVCCFCLNVKNMLGVKCVFAW